MDWARKTDENIDEFHSVVRNRLQRHRSESFSVRICVLLFFRGFHSNIRTVDRSHDSLKLFICFEVVWYYLFFRWIWKFYNRWWNFNQKNYDAVKDRRQRRFGQIKPLSDRSIRLWCGKHPDYNQQLGLNRYLDFRVFVHQVTSKSFQQVFICQTRHSKVLLELDPRVICHYEFHIISYTISCFLNKNDVSITAVSSSEDSSFWKNMKLMYNYIFHIGMYIFYVTIRKSKKFRDRFNSSAQHNNTILFRLFITHVCSFCISIENVDFGLTILLLVGKERMVQLELCSFCFAVSIENDDRPRIGSLAQSSWSGSSAPWIYVERYGDMVN